MRGGRNNNQKAKEKKKKKKTTNCQKLPHSQDCHSKTAKYEKRNKVFPASCACFSSRSSSACLPAYLAFQIRDAISLNTSICS
jgi:hypothetical protein